MIVGMGRPGELPTQRVARELRQRIEADEWASGDRLPSIGELAATYGVSRATVVRALRILRDDGLIVTAPSWGTFRA